MAEQQETIVIDDREMFQSAMAPEPQEDPAEPVPADERPRDEQGRFIPKEAEVEAKPEPPAKAETTPAEEPAPLAEPKDDAAGQVPSWRLREVREAREAAERRADEATRERASLQAQMQAMQAELQAFKTPKQEPVDFFADPDQALQQRLTPIEQRFAKLEQDLRLQSSRSAVIAEYGVPTVAEMEKAIAKAMQENHPDVQNLAMQMRASADPANVAMQWYQRNKLWDVTGGDPEKYKAKVLEEALKDPAYLAKAMESARSQAVTNPGSRPAIVIPPSINRAAGAGLNNSESDDDGTDDRSLFRHAMAPGRR